MRTALYARIFNSVDRENSRTVDGEALSHALRDVGGALFARLFVDEGAGALQKRVGAAGSISFEGEAWRPVMPPSTVHRHGDVDGP